MNTSTLLALAILLIFSSAALGQNLVPNGSFEEFVDCPEGLTANITDAVGWSQARGTCDYYNACAEPCGVGVPCNVFGYQEALQGNAYAGFVQFATPNLEYREQLTCELLSPLDIGEEYYFSMYLNRGHENFLNKASNGQGFYLTTQLHSSMDDDNPTNNPSPIENPTIANPEVIADSTNWTQFTASFIADAAYSYLVIGAFLPFTQLDTLDLGGKDPTGGAYYFVDEVRLSSDSTFAWQTLDVSTQASVDRQVMAYPNPTEGLVSFKGDLSVFNQVQVFSYQGQYLKTIVTPFSNVVSLETLPSGIYLFRLVGNNEEQLIRVQKR